jgi:hypothetical protein
MLVAYRPFPLFPNILFFLLFLCSSSSSLNFAPSFSILSFVLFRSYVFIHTPHVEAGE